jgi:predicted ATPase
MPVSELSVYGYRSIRQLTLKLRGVNVLVGPNGCGKSNLYNAMLLLARAAAGGFARAIAGEGGMPSVLWAGVQKRYGHRAEPRRVKLAAQMDDFGYELQCGLPKSGPPQGGKDHEGFALPKSQFLLDPQIKSESIWLKGERGRRTVMMDRSGPMTTLRNVKGRMTAYPVTLNPAESVLAQIQEPHLYPEISSLKTAMGRWRFYHHFRTDPGAPLRHPQIGVLTPVLSNDGTDLAAALQTVVEIGQAEDLREAVDRAFPGARVEVESERTLFRVVMHMPGVLRPLEAAELSDGTLRYLCLIAALLSPRPPALLGLNEPETSIHPDLIEPLARLITEASRHSQLWITTHSQALAGHIAAFSGEEPVRLALVDGETRIQ